MNNNNLPDTDRSANGTIKLGNAGKSMPVSSPTKGLVVNPPNEMLDRLQKALDQCRHGGLVRMNEKVYDLGAGTLYIRHANTQLFSGIADKPVKIVSRAQTILVVKEGAHDFSVSGVSFENIPNPNKVEGPYNAVVVVEKNVKGTKMNNCMVRGLRNGSSPTSIKGFSPFDGLLIDSNAEAVLFNVNVSCSNRDGIKVAEHAKLHATKCLMHDNFRHGIFLQSSGYCEFIECGSDRNGEQGCVVDSLRRAAFLFSQFSENGRNGLFFKKESVNNQPVQQLKTATIHVVAHCDIQENGKSDHACGILVAVNIPITLEGNSIGPHPKASLWFRAAATAAHEEKRCLNSRPCMIVANRFGGNVLVDKPMQHDTLYELNDFTNSKNNSVGSG